MASETKHFVTFYYPGSFVDEEETRAIPQRGEVGEIPAYAFGYQEWDREESEVDGEVLRGQPKNRGPMVLFGESFTAAEIEALGDRARYRILLLNMSSNGWERVVRTERGNFKPLTENVRLLPPRVPA
jgi:hypothetical protein